MKILEKDILNQITDYRIFRFNQCRHENYSATWHNHYWICDNCKTPYKCNIGGTQNCCPDYPHDINPPETTEDWESELEYSFPPELGEGDKMIIINNVRNLLQSARQKQRGELVREIEEYLEHKQDCILQQFEAGEPTKDGGYRQKFAGKWYKETPKCTCGLDQVIKLLNK